MSLRALLWVMEDAPVESHTDLVVLYALAERAHDDGTASWPSQEWIAHRARCSDRTVRRALASLEERCIIRRGDQRLTAHLTLRRKPVVWDLDLSLKRSDSVTGQCDRISKADTGDIKTGHHGSQKRTLVAVKADTAMSDKPSVNRPEPSVNRPGVSYPDEFEEFWRAYPKRTGKKAALRRWREAVKTTDPALIAAKAAEYARSVAGTEKRYIKNPEGWLSAGRYEDEFEPVVSSWLSVVGSDVIEGEIMKEIE